MCDCVCVRAANVRARPPAPEKRERTSERAMLMRVKTISMTAKLAKLGGRQSVKCVCVCV